MTGNNPFTIWFTGLSGSGKSTIAKILTDALVHRGKRAELLDSARIRATYNRDLGFTREQVETNLRRIGFECQMLNRNGVIAIAVSISPYKTIRDELRSTFDRFIEVFCDCPLEVVKSRDKNNLFSRAARGEIKNVAGVNAPYEPPESPEVHCYTDRDGQEKCVALILKTLELMTYLKKEDSNTYTAEEEEMVRNRLKDLGYI